MASLSLDSPLNKPAARGGILAHPQDVHCVIYHFVVLVSYGCAFYLFLHPELAGIEGPWSMAAFVVAAALMLGWISGIDVGVNYHNHIHRRITKSPFLNRWLGRLWTVSGGWPSYFWQHLHVVVHHANVMGPTDWTLPRRKPDGSFEHLWKYCLLHWPWRYARHLWQDFTGDQARPGTGRKALKELLIFLAFWSIPFWIDPFMALCLWVFPQWIGNVITMGSGMYVQHAGGREKSSNHPFAHSNTYLSKFFNLTMFNIGYHIEHHNHPNIHWTNLPELHERLKDDMIEHDARILPYGYYQAANRLAPLFRADEALADFSAQGSCYAENSGKPMPERPLEESQAETMTEGAT